jgi:hypothetical protein
MELRIRGDVGALTLQQFHSGPYYLSEGWNVVSRELPDS